MQLLLPMRASTSKTIVLLNENKLPDHEWAHIRRLSMCGVVVALCDRCHSYSPFSIQATTSET